MVLVLLPDLLQASNTLNSMVATHRSHSVLLLPDLHLDITELLLKDLRQASSTPNNMVATMPHQDLPPVVSMVSHNMAHQHKVPPHHPRWAMFLAK
jgi:hypothetical protein